MIGLVADNACLAIPTFCTMAVCQDRLSCTAFQTLRAFVGNPWPSGMCGA